MNEASVLGRTVLATLAQGGAPVFPAWQTHHAHFAALETEAHREERFVS